MRTQGREEGIGMPVKVQQPALGAWHPDLWCTYSPSWPFQATNVMSPNTGEEKTHTMSSCELVSPRAGGERGCDVTCTSKLLGSLLFVICLS